MKQLGRSETHVFSACGVEAKMQVCLPESDTAGVIGIAPGYMAGIKHYEGIQQCFAAESVPSFTVETPHGYSKAYVRHPNKQRAETLRIAMGLMQDKWQFEHFDLVGHSWGGANIMSLLGHNNDAVRSAVLLAPAGVVAAHEIMQDPIETTRWFMEEAVYFATHPSQDAAFIFSALHKAVTHPLRLLQQGLVAGEYIVAEATKQFRQQTPTALVAFQKDPIFKHDKLVSAAQKQFDIVHSYQDKNAGHFEPQKNPALVGRLVLDLMTQLQERSPSTIQPIRI